MKQGIFTYCSASRLLVMSGLMLASSAAFAQSKWNGMSRIQITQMQSKASANARAHGKHSQVAEPTLKALVNMKPGHTMKELEAEGFKVSVDLGDMGVVYLKLSEAERMDSIEGIKSISLNQKLHKHLDKANKDAGVDKIHAGEGLASGPYTGKGVVMVIIDGGFDPNHPMFLDKNGKSRVTSIVLPTVGENSEASEPTLITNPEEIAQFTTDFNQESHGTHVAGIAAGKLNVSDAATFPYEGVAPETEIAMISSFSEIAEIIECLDKVVKQYPDKRIVVNLSQGINDGPHDGTSEYELVLDKYLRNHPNVVFLISAGNEGDTNIVQRHVFTGEAEDEMNGAILAEFPYQDGARKLDTDSGEVNPGEGDYGDDDPDDDDLDDDDPGSDDPDDDDPGSDQPGGGDISEQQRPQAFQVWNDDEEPLAIELFLTKGKQRIWDSGKLSFSADEADLNAGLYVSTNPADSTYNANLASVMQGKDAAVSITGQKSANNNRYYLEVAIKGYANYADKTTYWNYVIYGDKGHRVTLYADNTELIASEGLTKDGTINAIATGKEVIPVGAYTTRNKYTVTTCDGQTQYYDDSASDALGEIVSFSSWGRLEDGRELPVISAPGVNVVSSVSSYDLNMENSSYTDKIQYNGRDYKWVPMSGTSMSSPYMAGVVALWLEANPKLTREQVVEIARETANHEARDKASEDDKVKWGAGKVDAYAGLKKALDLATAILLPINSEKNVLLREVTSRSYEAYVADANHVSAAIYTIDGQLVSSAEASGNTVCVSAPAAKAGVYLIKVASGNAQTVRKILVK